jgi:hypothetical protein
VMRKDNHPEQELDERKRIAALRRRVNRARAGTPDHGVTCPASRHLHIIADALMKPKRGHELRYPMLAEEPEHCAESIYAVLQCLWESRRFLKWDTRQQRWLPK